MFGIKRDRALDPGRRKLLLDLAMGTTAFGAGTLIGAHPAVAQVAASQESFDPNDFKAVESEIWIEQVALGLYEHAEGELTDPLKPLARLFRHHHELHLEQAVEALKALGGTVDYTIAPVFEKIPEFHDDEDVLRYALTVETMAVDAYVGLVGQLSVRWLRVHAAQILGGELAHVIALRAVLGNLNPAQASDIAFTTDLSPYLPARDR